MTIQPCCGTWAWTPDLPPSDWRGHHPNCPSYLVPPGIKEQPAPSEYDRSQPAIVDLIVADLQTSSETPWVLRHPLVIDFEARRQLGIQRYGTPLQPENGRDHLVDAYQKLLDHAVYLRGAVERYRREHRRNFGPGVGSMGWTMNELQSLYSDALGSLRRLRYLIGREYDGITSLRHEPRSTFG